MSRARAQRTSLRRRLRRRAMATVLAVAAMAAAPPAGASARQDAPANDVHAAQTAQFADPAGDTFSAFSATPLDECRTDILSYGAAAGESSVTFSVSTRCGSNPYTSPNWASNPIYGTNVAWLVDINDATDGEPNLSVFEYQVTLRHWSGSLRVEVNRAGSSAVVCTGTVGWDGSRTFSATIPFSCIDYPASFRMTARMIWDDNPFGATHLSPMDGTATTPEIFREIPVGDGPGAASTAPGQMDVFVRGQNDRLYTRHHNGSAWGDYLDLGGIITSTPAAASPGPGQLDVFVRGQDNALYTQHHNGTSWGGWVRLGGILTTAPAVVSRSAGTLDVFVAGFDRALYTMHFNGSTWGGWQNLGGIITATPAAASAAPGTMLVLARGQDNALWDRHFDGAGWTNWQTAGGIITAAPGATSRASGTYDVFARGTDNALWTNRWDGVAWIGWTSLGGVIASPPAAVSPGDGTSTVFVRGQNARLYWNRTDTTGNNWSGWLDLGGIIK